MLLKIEKDDVAFAAGEDFFSFLSISRKKSSASLPLNFGVGLIWIAIWNPYSQVYLKPSIYQEHFYYAR